MRTRYTARANRFWYTLRQCDQVLLVRTGVCDRGGVMDLIYKLQTKCQGKPFLLLLISPQASDEFTQIPNVCHHDLEFNPDQLRRAADRLAHTRQYRRPPASCRPNEKPSGKAVW